MMLSHYSETTYQQAKMTCFEYLCTYHALIKASYHFNLTGSHLYLQKLNYAGYVRMPSHCLYNHLFSPYAPATPYKRIMTFIFIFKQLHGWTIETILQHRPVVVLKNVWIRF